MAVMDEFREEREALKHGSLKQRLQYFWYYYRWHVIVGILVLVFGFSLIKEIVTQKDNAFYAVMLNSTELDSGAAYAQGFAEYAGIDLNEYEMLFDTSMHISTSSYDESTMSSSQKLMVYTAAAELDVMVSNTEVLQQYANTGTFYDLRELLTAEQLAQYEPYLYYVDQAVVEQIEIARDELTDINSITVPDPFKPDEMADPIPVGLCVSDCAPLRESFYFSNEQDVVLCVFVNSQRPETSVSFINYVFEQ